MKLKSFTREDCQFLGTGIPTVRVSKSGTFSFSKLAAVDLGLKVGNKIEILQDQDRPADWYVKKTEHQSGFILRNQSGGQVMVAAQPIARKLLKSIGKEGVSTTFHMGTEPVEEEFYAIITKAVKS